MEEKIENSIFHELPDDMKIILNWNNVLLDKWNNLTPKSRNEWICWITIVKKEETRKSHLERFVSDIISWKKRPCCWPWCPHTNPNSKKWFK